MRIICVDRSPLGLMDLKHKVKAIKPDAVIHSCHNPEDALSIAESEGCDVLLTEIDLGGARWEGLDLAKKMQAINPKVNIIFVTTFSEWEYARDVVQMRISGFVRKPYKQQQLTEEFARLRYAVT